MKVHVGVGSACAAVLMLAAAAAAHDHGSGAHEGKLSAYAEGRLDAAIAHSRRDGDRHRDIFRNPKETIAFFGVTPSMTVVESLPGGRGWYTKILLPYLDGEGALIGANYPSSVFPNASEERRAALDTWPETWPGRVAEWAPEGVEVAGAYIFGQAPDELKGAADAVIHVRALHGMARAGELDVLVQDSWDMLKPGGVVGVVQHRARADATDEQADGSAAYLRQADVVSAFEAAGFVLEAESEINANPNDPTDYDVGSWRLPPNLRGDEDRREEFIAIGESDRMTLRFRKPSA